MREQMRWLETTSNIALLSRLSYFLQNPNPSSSARTLDLDCHRFSFLRVILLEHVSSCDWFAFP